jgi:polyhydroxyalkanoate synthesis regulator phasin
MLDYIRKMTLAGAGLAIITAEKIQEMMDDLVKKGEMTEKEAREAVNEFVENSSKENDCRFPESNEYPHAKRT